MRMRITFIQPCNAPEATPITTILPWYAPRALEASTCEPPHHHAKASPQPRRPQQCGGRLTGATGPLEAWRSGVLHASQPCARSMQAVHLDLACRHLPPPARRRCGAGRGTCLLHVTQDTSGRRPAGGFGAQLVRASRLGGISFEGWSRAPQHGRETALHRAQAHSRVCSTALPPHIASRLPWNCSQAQRRTGTAGWTRYFELWRPAALCSTLPASRISVDP